MIITGGEIEGTGTKAPIRNQNKGTITIGVKDGNVNTNSPLIRGYKANAIYGDGTRQYKYL